MSFLGWWMIPTVLTAVVSAWAWTGWIRDPRSWAQMAANVFTCFFAYLALMVVWLLYGLAT